jgi:hypothetical protein
MLKVPDQKEINAEKASSQFLPVPVVDVQLTRSRDNSSRTIYVEKSITTTVIVHCTFSLAHQLLLLGTFFYTISVTGAVTNSAILLFVTNFTSVIRQAINFFLFYFFNKKFQKDVEVIFSCLFKKRVQV